MMQVRLVPVTPFQQNCAIVRCDKTGHGAVVDPGGDMELILRAVEEENVQVEKILLTHGHLDHAGAAGALAAHLGLQIIGPQAQDQFWLDGMAKQAETYGITGPQPCTPNQYLSQGDTVQVGEITLQVLHCPGHTPGHVAFFDPESRTALVGDLLFCGSIGRADFPKSDYGDLIRSIQNNLLPLGDDVTFHCGHGPSGTFGHERKTNPFLLTPERYGAL